MSAPSRRAYGGLVAAAALALCAQIGHASVIPDASAVSGSSGMSLYSGSKLVFGNSASILQLVIPAAGVLSLSWTDLDFSSSLATLDIGLSSATSNMGDFQSSGSTTLTLNGPVTLYAAIFATAQGSMDVGLYHVSASFMPAVAAVPLPSVGIFGLGAGFLGVLALACGRGWRQFSGRLGVVLGKGVLSLLAIGWRRGWSGPDFAGTMQKIATTPVA